MNYMDRIISKLADRICEKIARKVVWHLQRMTNAKLSGDDSPLRSTWDEICVQVQDDYSFYWETYVDVVKQFIASEVHDLPSEVKQAIWLQTQEGVDWIVDLEEDGSCEPEPLEEDIVHYIFSDYVMILASTWTNRRIDQYIYGE